MSSPLLLYELAMLEAEVRLLQRRADAHTYQRRRSTWGRGLRGLRRALLSWQPNHVRPGDAVTPSLRDYPYVGELP